MDEINQQIRTKKTIDQTDAQAIITNYIEKHVIDRTHLSAIRVMLPTYVPPLEGVYTEEKISSNLVKAYNDANNDPSTWWRNDETLKVL
jgi:hypothetical protein